MRSILLLMGMTLSSFLFAQSAPITIDGKFDDWNNTLATFEDVPETINGIDILSFQVTNDEDYLFLRIILDSEIDLTDDLFPQNLSLYIDTDMDENTGFVVQSGFGSEIGIQFGSLFAYYNVEPSSTVNFYDFGLIPAPTVTGNEFEMAIARNAIPDGENPLFTQSEIRIVFRETNGGDYCPNNGTQFTYTFDETSPLPAAAIPVSQQNLNDLRVTCYNMLGNGVLNGSRQPAFERIVQALDPDILGWCEASGVSTSALKNLMDTWIPLGTDDGWYLAKDEDLITCSRFPIIQEWTSLSRQFPTLIDLPESYPTDLMFVNAHLSCCAADNNRQDQVDSFVSFWGDAKTPGGNVDVPENTPLIYGGDLNLVGYAQQLTTLVTGDIVDEGQYGSDVDMDWDGTPLHDQLCRHTEQRFTHTWRETSQSGYPPGRLDFILFSDGIIESTSAFSLNTSGMSASALSSAGLLIDDTDVASDHLPVTSDFSFADLTDSDEDGVFDDQDNCPAIPNPDQEDWNNNGIGDHCEDSDNDDITDYEEINVYNTDPSSEDSDLDGLFDGTEVYDVGSDPNIQDTDGDGLTDALEWGYYPEYSPLDFDTNDNDCSDADEFGGVCGDEVNTCPGDLNGNGLVEAADLLLLLSGFGFACE